MLTGTRRDLTLGLLRNLGTQKEVNYYLKQFSSVSAKKFAIIKVGGGVIEERLDNLASSLAVLHRLGLYPIVIHGAGPQLDATLAEEGVPFRTVDGLRVTTPEVLEVVRQVLQRVNLKVVDALESLECRARPIVNGVFLARPKDPDRLGLVGDVTDLRLDAIDSSIRTGHVPILSCLGETPGGQILNINADVAAAALARHIGPFKIIFLTPTGGLLDAQGRFVPSINLAEDYDHLMAQSWVHSGMRLKLEQVKLLLDSLPVSSTVSITAPGTLVRELFTHRGAGTLVHRGEAVRAIESFAEVDQPRLQGLLETCFGRDLAPDYFIRKQCHRVYLTDSYRGCAIVTRERGVPYLDKFAVTRKAQGEGIGSSIWTRLLRENARLFWRARADNPINTWYFQRAQGSYEQGEWVVFWFGLTDFDEIRYCVEHALSLPATLREHGVGDDGVNHGQ